ncbi:MAG: DnaJ domain-containing protein [Polyangiaceae bacterium]|nr:DnaJ domain-containing protein [Polyangiaceae bacterium]
MLPAAGESSLPPASADPESVRLPPGRGPTRPPSYEPNPRAATPRIPSSLGKGDVVRAIARAIRARFTGALALEDSAGIRRIVFREGDFVTVASGAEQESLVAFLTERGDLPPEAARLERKLPAFGKHAGAALVAHGHLRQDELWPVLRAHAEWLMARSLIVDRCAASLEKQIPARLHAEPLVFGGATGAEVLVEVARRVIAPEQAILRLLGPDARLQKGPEWPLLSECNLMDRELEAVLAAPGSTVSELVARVGDAGFATALYILAELEILSSSRGPEAQPEARSRSVPYDPLDEVAIRTRIETRRALVEEGDYFALLGVGRNATGYEIRRAYLGLRREYAPETLLTAKTADLREDLDLVLEVLDEAYEILHDDARRNRYRRALEASQG